MPRNPGAPPSPPVVVYVVDDEPHMLRGLCRLLQSAGWETRAFDTPEAFLESAGPDMAGCLLLDVQMPGLNGLELQHSLIASDCHLPIIFLTGHGDVPTSVRAMKAGALDFLMKPVQEKELFDAIGRALERDANERRERRERAEIEDRERLLTPREREVFSLVITGMLNKQIAGRLGTTEKTIKVHRGRVMEKMRARSIAELVRIAERIGLPSQPPPHETKVQ